MCTWYQVRNTIATQFLSWTRRRRDNTHSLARLRRRRAYATPTSSYSAGERSYAASRLRQRSSLATCATGSLFSQACSGHPIVRTSRRKSEGKAANKIYCSPLRATTATFSLDCCCGGTQQVLHIPSRTISRAEPGH